MTCQRCSSERVAEVMAKCSDMCTVWFSHEDREHDGYVPKGIGIGGGDYVDFTYCLDCGQIQGRWPVKEVGE